MAATTPVTINIPTAELARYQRELCKGTELDTGQPVANTAANAKAAAAVAVGDRVLAVERLALTQRQAAEHPPPLEPAT